ncbi:MAG: hypothetical protein R3F11_29420 [Verrucomicrobiales bacterium]
MLKTTSPFDEVQREGWAECMELARRTDAVGIRAATKIADLGSLPGLYLKELIAILRNHPMAGEPERMRSLSIEIEMEPLRRDELISEEVSRRLDQPVEDAADFFSWLLNNGEHDRIIQLLSPRAAKINERLFAVYIDSLGAANRWGSFGDNRFGGRPAGDRPPQSIQGRLRQKPWQTGRDRPLACAVCPERRCRRGVVQRQIGAECPPDAPGRNFCEKNELEDVAKVSYECSILRINQSTRSTGFSASPARAATPKRCSTSLPMRRRTIRKRPITRRWSPI